MQKQILKQMQKKFQESLNRLQDDLGSEVVEGNAGGGMVRVQMNGRQEVASVKIDKNVVNPLEIDVLEDLLLVAIKDAVNKSQKIGAAKMSQLTGGLNIPGLF